MQEKEDLLRKRTVSEWNMILLFNHHLTHASLDAHSAYLAEKKQLFLDTRKDIKALQANYADCDWWIRPKGERRLNEQ